MSVTRYIESGYVEAGYFEVIVEPDVYVVPGYVAAGYATGTEYQTAFSLTADLTEVTATEASATLTSQASVSCIGGIANIVDATLSSNFSTSTQPVKTVDASVTFGALFSPTFVIGAVKRIVASLFSTVSMSATVSKFTGNEATLSNIISLSLQGIKQVDANATPSASFTLSATAIGIFILGSSSSSGDTLSSTFSITATPGRFQRISASLTQNFILFTSKWPNRGRPITWSKWAYGSGTGTTTGSYSDITFSSTEKKYGTHSLQIKQDGFRAMSSGLDIGYASDDGSVTIPYINTNQNFVWEFWAKMEGDNYGLTNNVVASIENTTSSPNLPGTYDSPSTTISLLIGAKADLITAKFYDIENATYRELSNSSTNWGSGWHHIVLRRYNSNTVELKVDNSSVDTYTYTGRIGGYTPSVTDYNRVVLYNWDQVPSGSDVFFDGLHFQLDSSTPTGYSSNPAGSGTENTLVLANFENNFDDDLGLTLEASATLQASGGTVTAIGGIFGVTATLTATSSVSANVEKVVTVSSSPNITASVSATATRIKQLASTVNSQATITATAVKTTDTSSSPSITFTTSIDGNAVRDANSDFDAIATQLTAVSKIGDFLINADVTASLTATANFDASAQATLQSAFSVSVNETLFKTYEATLQTTASLTCIENVTVNPAADLSSSFSSSISGDRIRFGVISVSSVANLDAETNPIKDAVATLTSSFNQPSMDFTRIRPFEGGMPAVISITANGIKTVKPSIDTIQTTLTTTINGNAVRGAVGDFDSIATTLFAAAKIGDFLIDADVVSSVSCVAFKKTGNIIVTTATASVTADFGIIKRFATTPSSEFTLQASGTTNIIGEANLDSTITVSADAIKAVEAGANLTGTGGFDVTAVATRNNEIIMSSAFTQSTVGQRIRFGVSSVDSATTLQITAGKLVSVGSTINTVATIVASVRVINIDDIVYTIPAETREFAIVSEDREHTIIQENREYTLT